MDGLPSRNSRSLVGEIGVACKDYALFTLLETFTADGAACMEAMDKRFAQRGLGVGPGVRG